MEKDLTEGVFALIRQEFAIEKKDIRRYSPLSLAYIGDAVYEVIIRSMLVAKSMASPNALHHAASGYVKANTAKKLHNCGISGRADGHIAAGDPVYLSYAYGGAGSGEYCEEEV